MHLKHQRNRTIQDLRISNGTRTYQMGNEIGRGGFGLVFTALDVDNGEFVAVKRVPIDNIDPECMKQLQVEIELLKRLDHQNIVKYIDTIKTEEYLHIVLEYMEHGSLSAVVKKFGNFSESLTAIYITQILRGLAYLHEQGVLHRDIKGANILTAKDGQVKLADFGVAMNKNDALNEVDVVGTPYWMAPEIIEMSAPTTACDVWSVGCVVLELLTGKPPYYDLPAMAALFRIVQDDHPPMPDGISEALRDFLMNTFKKEAFLRKSAQELTSHPWLKQKAHVSTVINQVQTFVDENDFDPTDREATVVVTTITNLMKQQKAAEAAGRRSSLARDSRRTCSDTVQPNSETTRLNGDDTIKLRRPSHNLRSTPPSRPQSTVTRLDTESFRFSEGAQNESDDDDMSWAHFDGDTPVKLSFKGITAPSTIDNPKLRHAMTYDSEGNALRSSARESVVSRIASASQAANRGYFSDGSAFMSGTKPTHSRKTSMISDEEIQASMLAMYGDSSKSSTPQNVTPATSTKNANNFDENGKSKRPSLWGSFKNLITGGETREKIHQSHKCGIANNSFGLVEDLDLDEMDNTMTFSPASNHNLLHFSSSVSNLEELNKYKDNNEDDDMFDDFEFPEEGIKAPSQLAPHFAEPDTFDDPFSNCFDEIDPGTNQERERLKALSNKVSKILNEISSPVDKDHFPEDICNSVLASFGPSPTLGAQLIQDHGVLTILQLLEVWKTDEHVYLIIQIINKIIYQNIKGLEYLSMLGLIPLMMAYARPAPDNINLTESHPTTNVFKISQVQVEAATFIENVCANPRTLQMFIGCGGLDVLVYFISFSHNLGSDLEARVLVRVGLNGVLQIFKLSGIRRNDFCKIMADRKLLLSLTILFEYLIEQLIQQENGHQIQDAKHCWDALHKTTEVLESFSKSVKVVVNNIKESELVQKLIRSFTLILNRSGVGSKHEFVELVNDVLKFLKNMTLEPEIIDHLDESGVIDEVMHLLKRQKAKSDDAAMVRGLEKVEASIIYLIFCLCRLNKARQDKAANLGIVPHLLRVIDEQKSTKQFALHVLCDLGHSTNQSTRAILADNKVVNLFISLLRGGQIVENWQTRALECLAAWMGNEPKDVEPALCEGDAIGNLIWSFRTLHQENFEKVSECLLELVQASNQLAQGLGRQKEFINELISRLQYPKAKIVLNLLRTLQHLFTNHLQQVQFIRDFELQRAVQKLAEDQEKVLVNKLANDLLEAFKSVS